MGAKTKEVGGGPSTGLANDFVGFLRQGLGSGTFGGAPSNQGQGQMNRPRGIGAGLNAVRNMLPGRQQTAADNFGRANPQGATEGIGGVINKFLSGDFGDKSYSVDTGGLKNMAGGGGYDFQGFNVPQVDFSGFNTNALQGFNANQPGLNLPNATGNQQMQGFLGGLQNIGNMGPESILKQFGLGPGALPQAGQANFNLGNANIAPYENFLAREQAKGQGDLRARFGAQGGSSFGTPAAFAEGNFLAESGARNAATLSDIGRAQQGLELQRQQGMAGIDAQNYGSYLDALSRGGQTGASLLGSQVSALGQGASSLLGGFGLEQEGMLGQRGQDISSAGLNLDALSKATGLDLQALQAQVGQNVDTGGLFNQFQQMGAQNQLGNRGLDIDAMSKALGLDLQGLGQQQNWDLGTLGMQQGMGNTLMQLLQNMSMPGIAQRQTIQQPSTFQNAMGVVTGLAGAAAPFFGPAGMFAAPVLKAASGGFGP